MEPILNYEVELDADHTSIVEVYTDKLIKRGQNITITLDYKNVLDWALQEPTYNNLQPDKYIFITSEQLPFPLFGPKRHMEFHVGVPKNQSHIEKLTNFFSEKVKKENMDLKDFLQSSYHLSHVWVPKDSPYWYLWGYRKEGNFSKVVIFTIMILIILFFISLIYL